MPASLYKPEYCKWLIEEFEIGRDVAALCARVRICRQTFYDWVAAHKEFAEAYALGQMLAQAWLEEQGRIGLTRGKDFNTGVWAIFMRNRCQMSEYRKIAIDFTGCKTANERLQVLEKEIAKGALTPSEVKYLGDYVKTLADVNQKTEIEEQVAELMKLAGKA